MRFFELRLWAVGIVLVLFSSLSRAQISPGPLSRAHQDLEGATKCTTCHNFGLGARGLRCLDCHGEIRRRVEEKHAYHARAYNVSQSQIDCSRCHQEHNGRQFQITKFERQSFHHDTLTDFPLLGKHKALTCETCHAPQHIEANGYAPARTWRISANAKMASSPRTPRLPNILRTL